MRIDPELEAFIEKETEGVSLSTLKLASDELSSQYRKGMGRLKFTSFHLAYLNVRLPATYAAITYVLRELKRRAPEIVVKKIADFGSGPGTTMWAAREVFDTLEECFLFEIDREFIELGKRAAAHSSYTALKNSTWHLADIKKVTFPECDLSVFAYSLCELDLSFPFSFSSPYVVFIEPGTPVGFKNLNLIREKMMNLGWNILAPCPKTMRCPLPSEDWCHFSTRFERTRAHRFLKGGSLGYEDEKFSYLIFSKEKFLNRYPRILREPQKNTKQITLNLCSDEGLKKVILLKRNKEIFNENKKSKWGDLFDES